MSSPSETPDPTQVPILTVTWDTVIGDRTTGYDPDSGPEVEPISLGELVVEGLVRHLAEEIKKDAQRWNGAVNQAREAATATMHAESERIVRETLSGEVQLTNSYGQRQGDPTTLVELIRKDVQEYLTKPNREDRYGTSKGFRALLREEVERALESDLRDVIRQTRVQVIETVKAKAVELFAGLAKDR